MVFMPKDFAVVVDEPRIGRRRFHQIEERIVSRRLPALVVEDENRAGNVVRSRQFVGHRDIAATFVDKTRTFTIHQDPLIDEGIEPRVRPEPIIYERLARNQMAVKILQVDSFRADLERHAQAITGILLRTA